MWHIRPDSVNHLKPVGVEKFDFGDGENTRLLWAHPPCSQSSFRSGPQVQKVKALFPPELKSPYLVLHASSFLCCWSFDGLLCSRWAGRCFVGWLKYAPTRWTSWPGPCRQPRTGRYWECTSKWSRPMAQSLCALTSDGDMLNISMLALWASCC